MSLAKLYVFESDSIFDATNFKNDESGDTIRLAMWASEPIPFDPMEIALHNSYIDHFSKDERPNFKMVHEYPLSGKPPMMTHIFENTAGERIIAAKGAPEAFIQISTLDTNSKAKIEKAIQQLAAEGFRILGVATAEYKNNDFPKEQQNFSFQFKGLIAFYDPPKENIQSVLKGFYQAGIGVKIVNGDNAATSISIAKQIGFKGWEHHLSGDELMLLNEHELRAKVNETMLFTRMFPEAKLKIINALKANNEIVAMTGDGVNDGPALKAAHIGIAMGAKGTEIAKQAASIILSEDDLSKMLDAVAVGRKIYTNLKKAIQYIISIHIPIVLTVFIPLALGWIYPNIFTPVHVIFLELIMGPTCSIIYENEPMEKNTMVQVPRPISSTFFNWKELTTSIIQGLAITVGTIVAYQYSVSQQYAESHTRTMVFTVLIFANIFLTLVNRSFYYSIITTLKYKNNLVTIIIAITIFITACLLYIPMFANFFQFEALSLYDLGITASLGLVSVIWYEIVKSTKRKHAKQ
jgi:Ca2+-transporting ATPase